MRSYTRWRASTADDLLLRLVLSELLSPIKYQRGDATTDGYGHHTIDTCLVPADVFQIRVNKTRTPMYYDAFSGV